MSTVMLVATTEGLRPTTTINHQGAMPRDVAAFLKTNPTTMGVTVQYAVTTDGSVYRVLNRGKLGIRKVTRLIAELDAVEWLYSYAFAGKVFVVDGEQVPLTGTIDLITNDDVFKILQRR